MGSQKILVAFASKHGSTKEIAELLGDELAKHGLDVDVNRVQDIRNIMRYDIIVLGSAIYAGRWLRPARQFVYEFAEELANRQIWLFSSGPIGNFLSPDAEKAVQLDLIIAFTKAKDHKIFAGKLDKSKLNFGERAVIAAVHGKEGDFRDWSAIKAWAKQIAKQSTQ